MKIFYFFVFASLMFSPILSECQNISTPAANHYESPVEEFNAKLKSFRIFKKVKEKTGASSDQMKLFCRYYADTLIVDKQLFVQDVLNKKIQTDEDIRQHAEKKIAHYVAMYNKFAAFSKEFPDEIEEHLASRRPSPPTLACNPACDNIGFESGTLSAWTACYAANTSTSSSFLTTPPTCFGPLGGVTTSAADPATGTNQVSITSGGGFDPVAGALIPVVCPTGGNYSVMVGDGTVIGYGVGILEQTFMVTAKTANLTYMYAVVLENPGHPYYYQPYFKVELFDQNGNLIPGCGEYDVVSAPNLPGYTTVLYNGVTCYCKPWTTEYVPLQAYIGTCVTIKVTASDCALGGHFGYGYFDASCDTILKTPAICGTKNAVLTAPAGAASYAWSGPCIVGSKTTQTITVSCPGTYTCVATSSISNACNISLTTTVTFDPALNVNLLSTTNVSCFGGSNGAASIQATGGTSPYTYSWAAPTSGTNTNVSGLSAGSYTVYVTDAIGCEDTIGVGNLKIVITQPPPILANIAVNTNAKCSGVTNGSLTATVVSGGTPPFKYSWAPTGTTGNTATGLSLGTYTVTFTDINGCTGKDSAAISNPPPVTGITSSTQTSCTSNTGTATVVPAGGTPGYSYAWAPSGGTDSTAKGLGAGNYIVTITDANGCTGTASVIVTSVGGGTVAITASSNITCFGDANGSATATMTGGFPPYNYAWTPSGGSNPSATGLIAGTYIMTVTDASGCIAITSVAITQPPQLSVAIPSITNILCNNGNPNGSLTATVSGGTPGYIYAWSPSGGAGLTTTPLNAGVYTITVIDANGCPASADATVTEPEALTATTTIINIGCFATTGTIIVNANGGTPDYTYLWSPTGSTNSTVSGLSAGTYNITVTDANSCTAVTTVTMSAPPQPDVSFATNPVSGCQPLCIQFSDFSTVSSGTITQWKWSFGDHDSSSDENPIYCYPDTGHFTVSLTAVSNIGCSSTLSKLNMITVYPHPQAAFTYTPRSINISNPLVQFTDNSYDKYSIIYWYWNFGDGADSISSQQNPSHLYGDTGTYCASLVIMDEHGCTDTSVNCLIVAPLFTLYIPNAFSPGGNVNNIFIPKGTYIKNFEMYIFDRWGMQLYHTTDILKGWNGTANGGTAVCQEDTYVYDINVTDSRGVKHRYVGDVYLLK